MSHLWAYPNEKTIAMADEDKSGGPFLDAFLKTIGNWAEKTAMPMTDKEFSGLYKQAEEIAARSKLEKSLEARRDLHVQYDQIIDRIIFEKARRAHERMMAEQEAKAAAKQAAEPSSKETADARIPCPMCGQMPTKGNL